MSISASHAVRRSWTGQGSGAHLQPGRCRFRRREGRARAPSSGSSSSSTGRQAQPCPRRLVKEVPWQRGDVAAHSAGGRRAQPRHRCYWRRWAWGPGLRRGRLTVRAAGGVCRGGVGSTASQAGAERWPGTRSGRPRPEATCLTETQLTATYTP